MFACFFFNISRCFPQYFCKTFGKINLKPPSKNNHDAIATVILLHYFVIKNVFHNCKLFYSVIDYSPTVMLTVAACHSVFLSSVRLLALFI